MSAPSPDQVVLLPEPIDTTTVTGKMDSVPMSSSSSSSDATFWSRVSVMRVPSAQLRQWLSSRHQALRPWLQFFSSFSRPQTVAQWSRRVMHNAAHYQSNYACVCVLLLIYCLLTSPLLLIAMGAVGAACHVLRSRQSERPLVVAGRQVPLTQQYVAVALLSVPLMVLVGASTALFWVMGASLFVVGLHASFHARSITDASDEQVELFEVTSETV